MKTKTIDWQAAVNRRYLKWSVHRRLAQPHRDIRLEERRLECIGIARWLGASVAGEMTNEELLGELDRLFDLAMRRIDEIDETPAAGIQPEVPAAAQSESGDEGGDPP